MKAIITDLDRTLLRTDKTISAYTLSVLKRCREKGMLLLVASARPLRTIAPYHAQIGFDAIAATNGVIIQLPGRQLIHGLRRESAQQALAALMQYPDVLLSAETSGGLFANGDIPEWDPVIYHDFPRLPAHVIPYKILASSPHRQLYEEIAALLPPDAYHTVAGESLIQIMSTEATKWKAIRHMLAHFQLSPADAVYFGDDNDDVEALRQCGLGVAVQNAIPAALAAADRIAPDNDSDGVARFIEENILERNLTL